MSRRPGAGWLAAPLALLMALAFLAPLGLVLWQAVENGALRAALPETARLLRAWDGEGPAPEAVAAALLAELPRAAEGEALGRLSRRLNEERQGMRPLLLRAARQADRLRAPYAEALAALDPAWADPALWRMLRRNALPVTDFFLLRALDLQHEEEGGLARVQGEEAVFAGLFLRTLVVSAQVTLLCLLLGYPLAWWMSGLAPRRRRIVMLLLLLPFWTSALVRAAAWFILLQREGPLAGALVWLGFAQTRPSIIFTRPAVLIAMVHVMLPFMVLPLQAVMRGADRAPLRAAASLGANGWQIFRRVFLPMTLPGLLAGAVLVFTLSVGFYVTPALVGGARDQMVSGFIAFFVNNTVNWGMAAALSVWLLLLVGAGLWLLHRLGGGRFAAMEGR